MAELVEGLYADAVEDGHGGEDFAAIVTEAEKRAKIQTLRIARYFP